MIDLLLQRGNEGLFEGPASAQSRTQYTRIHARAGVFCPLIDAFRFPCVSVGRRKTNRCTHSSHHRPVALQPAMKDMRWDDTAGVIGPLSHAFDLPFELHEPVRLPVARLLLRRRPATVGRRIVTGVVEPVQGEALRVARRDRPVPESPEIVDPPSTDGNIDIVWPVSSASLRHGLPDTPQSFVRRGSRRSSRSVLGIGRLDTFAFPASTTACVASPQVGVQHRGKRSATLTRTVHDPSKDPGRACRALAHNLGDRQATIPFAHLWNQFFSHVCSILTIGAIVQ